MVRNITKLSLPLVLIAGAFFIYGGCHNSNGNNMGNVVSDTDNIFTPIVASVLAPPVPVRGSDGQFHLTYELNLTNSNTFDWEVVSIEVLDGHPDGQILKVVSGEEVMDKMQLLGTRQPTDTLLPTQSALVYLTFTVPSEEDIPDSLLHRLTITVPGGLPEFITMFLELPQDQEDISSFVAPVDVDKKDVCFWSAA